MDLVESRNPDGKRHPWELSRYAFVKRIASQVLAGQSTATVYDVGSGDGYLINRLAEELPLHSALAIDTFYTDQILEKLNEPSNAVCFVDRFPEPNGQLCDFGMFLDVLEHIEDDYGALSTFVMDHLNCRGKVLITVPAFQSLMSSHDVALRHYRRYNSRQLRQLVDRAGLNVLEYGYLFSSLLPVRIATVIKERTFGRRKVASEGIGSWNGSDTVTQMINSSLQIENRLLTVLSRLGLRLPGLSTWVLAEKSDE